MHPTVLEPDVVPSAANGRARGLDMFFDPKSVAVIGATDKPAHVGRAIMYNLITSPFGGSVYAVNPNRASVLGRETYPTVSDIPCPIDLAVIATPAAAVPEIISDCARHGVRGAIIISSEFRHPDSREQALQGEILRIARQGNVRLLGPNSLGIMRPGTGFNATFAPALARPGSIALVSQSGAICTSLLDWATVHQVGFSAVVSIGSMLDVGWGEVIDFLGKEPKTRAIAIYMESIGDARALLSACREVTLDKPILLIKGGRTDVGASVAATQASAGNGHDAVLDAALRRVGVLRVHVLEDIFHIMDALAHQPRPAGPRLAIVTNAAGPGVLATDALVGLGDELAVFTPGSAEALSRNLVRPEPVSNPIDLLETAGPLDYEIAVELASKDPHVDGVLVIQAPQATSDRLATANCLTKFANLAGKPILASWLGSSKDSESDTVLNRAGIPTFPFPETAVRAFHFMWRYTYNLRALYQTPSVIEDLHPQSRRAAGLIATLRQSGRTELSAPESQELFNLYGIPAAQNHDAPGEYLAFGMKIDPEFGPVLFFGTGGPFGTATACPAFALPPLNTTLAQRFLEQSKVYKVLLRMTNRGEFDPDNLKTLLVRLSQLVVEQPFIREIELHLRIAQPDADALSGRISLHPIEVQKAPKLAIRPYPSQYVSDAILSDGTRVTIRPVRPEDEPAVARFHSTLSNESVYLRYFAPISLETRTRHERLTRTCFIDYDRQMAFVAEAPPSQGQAAQIVAVGRIVRIATRNEAELAAIVSDEYQQCGAGSAIVARLIQFARDEQLSGLTAYVLTENIGMRHLLEKAGFRFSFEQASEMLEGRLSLAQN